MLNKLKVKRVSLDLPLDIINEIDEDCRANYISKRKWFIDAAIEKIERDRLSKIDMIIKK